MSQLVFVVDWRAQTAEDLLNEGETKQAHPVQSTIIDMRGPQVQTCVWKTQ